MEYGGRLVASYSKTRGSQLYIAEVNVLYEIKGMELALKEVDWDIVVAKACLGHRERMIRPLEVKILNFQGKKVSIGKF